MSEISTTDKQTTEHEAKTIKKSSKRKSSTPDTNKSKSIKTTDKMWQLEGKKRINVDQFKSKYYVNIREYYFKNGEDLPGNKGVALSFEDWSILNSSIDPITEMLTLKNLTKSIKLSNKKRISITEFKGKTYVSIREYYERDGVEFPGKKGINITANDWKLLVGSAHEIHDTIKSRCD
jgi:hypothetical protein